MLLLRRQMNYIVLPLVNIFKLVGLVKPEIDRTMFTRSAVFRKEHQIVDWNIKRVIHKMVKNGIYYNWLQSNIGLIEVQVCVINQLSENKLETRQNCP